MDVFSTRYLLLKINKSTAVSLSVVCVCYFETDEVIQVICQLRCVLKTNTSKYNSNKKAGIIDKEITSGVYVA